MLDGVRRQFGITGAAGLLATPSCLNTTWQGTMINQMGRIVTNVKIKNLLHPEVSLSCDALVDTGAAYLVLPLAWKERLGKITTIRKIDCETATQDLVSAEVCGPVEIRLDGFDPVYGEVLFL